MAGNEEKTAKNGGKIPLPNISYKAVYDAVKERIQKQNMGGRPHITLRRIASDTIADVESESNLTLNRFRHQ